MSDMPPAGLPRRNLAKYVKAAVGFCAVLLVVAGVRAALTKATHSEPVASAATAAPPPAPTVAPPPAPPDPPAAAAPATAPAPVAQVDTAAAPPPVSDKTAAQELKDAQSLLDRGKIKDAAAAAQRSIALDPTDANAWLVLGAADQMLGKGKDAHDAFTECTKQAKKGEIRECRAMLTWNGPR
jgi:tetratricopeptide (TPR) repeat protein